METEETKVELVATEDLLDQVAKAIFRAAVISEPFLTSKYSIEVHDSFKETFNKVIEGLWSSTETVDSYERERYRIIAKAVLTSLGYKTPSFSHPLDPLLV